MTLPLPIPPVAPPPFDLSAANSLLMNIDKVAGALEMSATIRQGLGRVATEQWEGPFRNEFDLEHGWGLLFLGIARNQLRAITGQVKTAVAEAEYRNAAFAAAEAAYHQAQDAYLRSVMDEMLSAAGRP